MKYLLMLLFNGLALGGSNSDLLIFKNGLQYHGEFLKIENHKIYFKPKDSSDYQNVFTYQLDRVELKNGEVLNFKNVKKSNKTVQLDRVELKNEEVLNFKNVKKPNKTVTEKINKTSILGLKKGKQIIEFGLGQRLIINNDIKGVFESMTKDYLSIRTDLSQKEIPISSITKIHVQDTVSISFSDGLLAGAGSCILPIAILSIGNQEAHYGIVFASVAAPIMAVIGGLTSLIIPKRVRTKMYLIKENAWEIVND
tara:strand:+ start:65 stop:826 length:762 start_codon:yes stop_codon:yes gene_type:complete